MSLLAQDTCGITVAMP